MSWDCAQTGELYFYYLAVFFLFCIYCDTLLWPVQLQHHCGESDSVITITAILLHPTMQVLLLSTLFFLATAVAYRDPGFCINCSSRAVVCYYKDSFLISRAVSPSLERIPSLFLCANRRMRLPPRVKLNLGLSPLLLLAVDVSFNPGLVVPNLHLVTVNAHSMRDKAPALSDLVVNKGTNLLGITETWLTTRETSSDVAEMTHHGFSFLQIPRVNKRGGGVGLFVSNAFKFTPISLPSQSGFESISGKLECGRAHLSILNIYHPPGPASSSFSELLVAEYTVLHGLTRSWFGIDGWFQPSHWILVIRC